MNYLCTKMILRGQYKVIVNVTPYKVKRINYRSVEHKGIEISQRREIWQSSPDNQRVRRHPRRLLTSTKNTVWGQQCSLWENLNQSLNRVSGSVQLLDINDFNPARFCLETWPRTEKFNRVVMNPEIARKVSDQRGVLSVLKFVTTKDIIIPRAGEFKKYNYWQWSVD